MIEKLQAEKCFDITSGRMNYLGGLSRETNIQHLNKILESGIEFKPSVNILIGENGSGKSTVLNLIRYLTFCMNSFEPNVSLSDLDTRFELENNKMLYENFKLAASYDMPIFNLYQMSASSGQLSENQIFKNRNTATQYMDLISKSRGQNLMGDVSQLLHTMFNSKTYKLVLQLVRDYCKDDTNNIFDGMSKVALDYYEQNNKSSNRCTILMDEPDQGLDITNLEEIYGILSYDKPDTQIIAVVHNPILIYKLAKLDFVNIIEMSDGYLNKIKAFVED